ncbi:hypothetical protein TYRP_019027 [Tyrophagus putrescentiae]|nr:hypothetical protein TYRP_019027 [Tyrophagus putrescentiae]
MDNDGDGDDLMVKLTALESFDSYPVEVNANNDHDDVDDDQPIDVVDTDSTSLNCKSTAIIYAAGNLPTLLMCHCVHITAISGPFKWEKKESEESASSEGIEKKTTTAQPKSARAAAVCRLGVRPQ